MAGTDTIRGIAFQQAQAVLEAIHVLESNEIAAIRVEGLDDVVDVEALSPRGNLLWARQYKTRSERYSWGQEELLAVLRRWSALPHSDHASFDFVTDGKLGPTGEAVRVALIEASEGRPQSLANLMGVSPSSDVCARLSRARVLVDRSSVASLLMRAEREIVQAYGNARSAAELSADAEATVDKLFRLLTTRAGNSLPDARTIDRREIADVLGVPDDWARSANWPGVWAARYIAGAADSSPSEVVDPWLKVDLTDILLARRSQVGGVESVAVEVLLTASSPILLTGGTGTGKTTASRLLVAHAASIQRVAVHAKAEAYLPGRLGALVADSIGLAVGSPMPVPAGRAALDDPSVLLILDGVSEIPGSDREALAEELRTRVLAPAGASVMLVGRDLADLRALLPSSAAPSIFTVSPLDREMRRLLVTRLLSREAEQSGLGDDADASTLAAQIESALGEAASNPLLFRLGYGLVRAGVPFTNRASLYRRSIEQLAARTGTTGIAAAARVAGVAFSRLIDQGRRYADPYEWAELLEVAVSDLGQTVQADRVATACRRAGLVMPVGYAQTVTPMHDSIADYLSAAAIARGDARIPSVLGTADAQRLQFIAELGALTDDLAFEIARDMPFLVVKAAPFDRRPLTERTPVTVASVLRTLLPGEDLPTVALWNQGNRTHACVLGSGGESRWIDEGQGRELSLTLPTFLDIKSPLDAVVRLWRHVLIERMGSPPRQLVPRAQTQIEACEVLRQHTADTEVALDAMRRRLFTTSQLDRLATFAEPAGLTALILPADSKVFGREEWLVYYRRSAAIDVRPASEFVGSDRDRWGSGIFGFMVSESPQSSAAHRLRELVNIAVGDRFL